MQLRVHPPAVPHPAEDLRRLLDGGRRHGPPLRASEAAVHWLVQNLQAGRPSVNAWPDLGQSRLLYQGCQGLSCLGACQE